MTEAEGGELVPCRLEFPDVMEYKIFKVWRPAESSVGAVNCAACDRTLSM